MVVTTYSECEIAEIASALGLHFHDITLLGQALVHRSVLGDSPDSSVISNERMEFLGDAILNAVVSHELSVRHPEWPEGPLTQARSTVVSNETLARVSRAQRFHLWLILGRGDRIQGEHQTPSVQAAALEALIGAVFLDQGYDVCRDFVLRVLNDEIVAASHVAGTVHPKSHLHDLARKKGYRPPKYRTVKKTGPNNAPIFTVHVELNGQVLGTGRGRNIKAASTDAARKALLSWTS